MEWNCLWGWVFFAVRTVVPSCRPYKTFLYGTSCAWLKVFHPCSPLRQRGTSPTCSSPLSSLSLWWEVFSSALCLATCSAWTGMILSILHSLLLIHVRLANVASKWLLPEGMSTSQGISIFSVILACTVDRLYDIYTNDCPSTRLLHHLHLHAVCSTLTC